MRITRQRLKQIIMEEVALQEATPDIVDADMHSGETAYFGNARSNQGGMGEITESEGMEILQQAAQTLIDAGILGAENPQEVVDALRGIAKAALLPLAGAAMGGAAMAGKDAIDKLRSEDPPQKPETVQEEEEEGTLEELITQAIKEELGQF